MKSIACLSALIAVSVAACSTTGCVERDPRTIPHGVPQIHIAEPERDLGEIALAPRGHDVKVDVHNRGFEDLVIQKLTVSCRCTKAQIKPEVIPPDGHGTLTLTIAPERAEEQSASVVVCCNDPLQPLVPVVVSWKAVAPLSFEPALIDFGRLRPNATAQTRVRLVRRTDLPQGDAYELGASGPAVWYLRGGSWRRGRRTTPRLPNRS